MLLYRSNPSVVETAGYHVLLEGAAQHLEWLSLGLITLHRNNPHVSSSTGSHEAGLVVLDGTVTITVQQRRFVKLGHRRSVFEAPPAFVYVPIHSDYEVLLESESAHVAVCLAKATRAYEPFAVSPEEVTRTQRGDHQWRREVRDVLVANGEGRVDRLVLGETINEPGAWSGYPPHRHEEERPGEEVKLEEAYYFKLDPPGGFGIQVHYDSHYHDDMGFLVRDGDAFAIPDGYHPVVAAGGYRLYYLWFMAGPSGRTLMPFEDPQHRWVKEL